MPSCVRGNAGVGIDSVMPTMGLRLVHNFGSPHVALGHPVTPLAALRAGAGTFEHTTGPNRRRGSRTAVT